MIATHPFKRTRRTTPPLFILVLLATLLFSRLALAFYVCPAPPPQAIATMAHMSGTDCVTIPGQSGMMDDAQPALCAQYFSDEQQITSAVAHAQAPEPFLLLAYPLLRLSALLALPPDGSHVAAPERSPGPGGSGDTLYLQTLRLRI